MAYSELSIEERATIQVSHAQGMRLRKTARIMGRAPSTISREIRRNRKPDGSYCFQHAQRLRQERRHGDCPKRKCLPGSERFALVEHMLRRYLSPEQIAGQLKRTTIPRLQDAYICRETIYNAIYALPVGELRKELIHCLRQGQPTRKPRRGQVGRRSQIPDMVGIHLRPPEVAKREMPGH